MGREARVGNWVGKGVSKGDNQKAIVSQSSPAFVGKERVTKFWEARVTSTYPQFLSRAKREWEIFYVFCKRARRESTSLKQIYPRHKHAMRGGDTTRGGGHFGIFGGGWYVGMCRPGLQIGTPF